jgi:NAD(P)-dependent dehydrogenase (short-subunit alcohol dehydrogenase family)
MNIEGKVAVVTGSSRGLGKAMAIGFAEAGADVVVVGRTEEAGGPLAGTIHETAEAITKLGRKALAVRCDVSNEEHIESLTKQALDTFGRVDILVNNAAFLFYAPFAETPLRRFDLAWRVNTRAFFMTAQAFLPGMIERKWGHIINIAPPASTDVPPGGVAYLVSKQAITLMSLGAAKELEKDNVAINCLWPENRRGTEGMLYVYRDEDKSAWLTPQVMADAALAVVQKEPASFTGNALTDQDMLRGEGVTDFSKYRLE